MKKIILMMALLMVFSGCENVENADRIQSRQQEQLSKEATSSVGMPAIKNFRERRLVKEILELRDQDGLATYTYVWNEMQGKKVFFCNSIGYGIPYATQFTNPQVDTFYTSSSRIHISMPQADPNGLFSPQSAEGTWVMCKDPNGDKARPVYIEPRIIVSPFKLND